MVIRVIFMLVMLMGTWGQENARQRTITFGSGIYPWENFALENAQVKEGPRGPVITLQDRSGSGALPGIDLFLSFDSESVQQPNYRIDTPLALSRQMSRLGTASGVFQEGGNPLVLTAQPSSLFFPGNLWHDFKIEFWAYLPTFSEGASILTWKGAFRRGRDVVTQELRIGLVGRVMELQTKNFFQMPQRGAPAEVRLRGRRPMLPGRWTHHRFQFDASTGLLEYFRDGTPESSIYVTATGREGGQIFVPLIGELSRPEIMLGENLSALVDEFKISRQIDSLFGSTATYDARLGAPFGFATSPIVDLGDHAHTLEGIDWETRLPASTQVSLQVRAADALDWSSGRRPQMNGSWINWSENRAASLRGRYFQIRLRLDGEGSGEQSPVVERLQMRFSKIPEPMTPMFLALKEGAEIELSWRPVADDGVRKYRVFWSLNPNRFEPTHFFTVDQDFGRAFSWDNGERPRIRFRVSAENLRNAGDALAAEAFESGRLLYFAVTSIRELENGTGATIGLLSPFSEVLSGRRKLE